MQNPLPGIRGVFALGPSVAAGRGVGRVGGISTRLGIEDRQCGLWKGGGSPGEEGQTVEVHLSWG